MNTHEHRLVFFPLTLYQGHVLESAAGLTERNKLEMSVFSRHIHHSAYAYQRLALQSVCNEVLNCYDFKIIFCCELHELRKTCHRTVVVHYLHQRTCRIKARELAEVYCCLRVSASSEHAVVLCIKRIYVARASECPWRSLRIGKSLDCLGPVVSRHTGRAAFELIHCNSERSAQHRCVFYNLTRKVKLIASAYRYRRTEHATSMLQHEINLLCCNFFSGNNKIALIFAVFIVYDNYKLASLEVLKSFFDCINF